MKKQCRNINRMDLSMTKMYNHYKGHLGSSNLRMLEVERQVSVLKNGPNSKAHEGDFDFGQSSGFPLSASSVQLEIQQLREELADMRKAQACEPPTKTPSSSMDALFPVKTHEEIIARLKAVETRGSTGVTCNLGGTTFTSETDLLVHLYHHSCHSLMRPLVRPI
jgi:hypothetical protein